MPSREGGFDRAEPLELGADPVAARDEELPGERARHDVITGLEPATVRGELARQPRHRAQRMAEHRVATPRGHLDAVDGDPHADRGEVEIAGGRHPWPDHEVL